MPNIPLSDAGLRSIQPPQKGTCDYWDTKFKGFGVRVSQGGTKTFVLNIHKARRSLGRYGIVPLAEARTEARRISVAAFCNVQTYPPKLVRRSQ
jgi:Arm DNA-binding domain